MEEFIATNGSFVHPGPEAIHIADGGGHLILPGYGILQHDAGTRQRTIGELIVPLA